MNNSAVFSSAVRNPQGIPASAPLHLSSAHSSSGAREARHLEAPPVSARCHACHALEKATEEGGVLVADLPADLVGRRLSPLEPAFRVLDAEALHVVDRREPR